MTSVQGRSPARKSDSSAAADRAKEAVRAQLRTIARAHIAEHGAAELSLRAVGRELGMPSSAVYRYIRSREELISSLVAESFVSLAEAAEAADRFHAGAGADPATRWLGTARGIRQWALLHPHEYVLIYGTPTTSEGLPPAVAMASLRLWRVVGGIVGTAVTTGELHPPSRSFDVDGLLVEQVGATVGRPAPPFEDSIVRGMALFSSVLGAITAELCGPFHSFSTDPAWLFDLVVATGAQGVGLDLPVDPPHVE